MSKSILVIDTPEQVCQKCKLCYECDDGFMCGGSGKVIPDGEKPDWCPLKELPEKKEARKMRRNNLQAYCISKFDMGYNACIDEILKETFGNPTEYNGDNIGGRD